VSKLFDKLKSAARSRGQQGRQPSALLSHALHRAADERKALRAASPDGLEGAIDVEASQDSRIQEEAEAQERLAAAARDRADAEQLALQTARLRVEAEQRANHLAKEREAIERNANIEARWRAQAERDATQAVEKRLRLQDGTKSESGASAARERRRLKRRLFLAICALAVVGAIIAARTFIPNLFGERTPHVFRLDRELKTPPEPSKD
jgi:hypothetical protein